MNLKNKLQFISLIIISSVFLSACTKKETETNLNLNMTKNISPSSAEVSTKAETTITTKTNDTLVAITTKDGQIVLKLYAEDAPNTVANFIKKADSGFYKDLTFHRVEPGFVVQGGDPLGNGTGGGNIKSEINNIPFVRGSIGLARANNIEISNDSQFYICLSTETCSQLTGLYVNFGEVISGLDVVDKIQKGDKIVTITTKTK